MEPLGSLQLRTNCYANKRIEMQWTELVTPRKAVKYGAFTHHQLNRMLRQLGSSQMACIKASA